MPYLKIERLSGQTDTIEWTARAVAKGSLTQRVYWRNDPDARPGKPTTLGYITRVYGVPGKPAYQAEYATGRTVAEAEQNATIALLRRKQQRDAIANLYGWYRKRQDEEYRRILDGRSA